MTSKTQEEVILGHLRKVGNISGLEAHNLYKVRSLTRRITSLRRMGVPIQPEHKRDATGQRYVRYHLVPETAKA